MKRIIGWLGMSLIVLLSVAPVSSRADILQGTVIGGFNLSCNLWNMSQRRQDVYQVQYEWYCSEGPTNSPRYHTQTTGCMGFCLLEPNQTGMSQGGPFTQDCKQILDARCTGFSIPSRMDDSGN